MKVALYYRFLGLGGVETALLNRVAAFRSVGITPYFFFSEYYGAGARYLANRRDIHQVTLDGFRWRHRLRKLDAIIVIDSPQAVASVSRTARGLPIIYESHASYAPALKYFYSVLGERCIRAIVVPSRYNRNLVLQSELATLAPVVIRNCIDTSLFHVTRQISTDVCTPPSQRPLILWVGRLEDQKNPQEMIAIARRLEDQRPDIRFRIVGDADAYGEYLNKLKQGAQAPLPSNVQFDRRVRYENMPALFNLAAESGGLLLSTSLHESAPMIFLEAMACECPVLSSAVGGVAELIQHRVTGMLYPPGNVEAAIEQIDLLTSTSSARFRRSLRNAAARSVRKNHSPREIGQQYKALLETLLAQ